MATTRTPRSDSRSRSNEHGQQLELPLNSADVVAAAAPRPAARGDRVARKRFPNLAKELRRAILDDSTEATGIVVTPTGKIDRDHYAGRLGVSSALLSAECKSVLEEPAPERAPFPTPLGKLALDRIEKDAGRGHVACWRGCINLSHYARQLGTTSSAVRYGLGPILLETEKKLIAQGLLPQDNIWPKSRGDRPFTPSPIAPNALADKFDRLLQADHRSVEGIVTSNCGSVNRLYYAQALGVHLRTLLRNCMDVLSHWNAALRPDAQPLSRLGIEAKKLIDADIATHGRPQFWRDGINVSAYARRLGATPRGVREALRFQLPGLTEQFRDTIERSTFLPGSSARQRPKSSPPATLCSSNTAETRDSLRLTELGPTGREKRQAVQADKDTDLVERFVRRIAEAINSNQPPTREPDGSFVFLKYAKELNVSRHVLVSALKRTGKMQAINVLPTREPNTRLRERIGRAIRDDLELNRVPQIGRGGKLDRRYYARLVGVHPSYLSNSGEMEVFDKEYGSASYPERLESKLRAWLGENYSSGTMHVRNQKVDRDQALSAIGRAGRTILSRYPGLLKPIEEYDARIKEERYQSKADKDAVERLTQWIERSPRLNKDKLRINRVEAAKVLGIAKARFLEEPLGSVIKSFEAMLRDRAAHSNIEPLIGGRIFSFSHLGPFYGEDFCERVARQFASAYAGVEKGSSIKNKYEAVTELLLWHAKSTTPEFIQVSQQTIKYAAVSLKQWIPFIIVYREELVSQVGRGARRSTTDGKIQNLRLLLDRMAPVFPAIDIPIHGIKYPRRFTVHRPSLAEVVDPQAGQDDDFIEAASTLLTQAADQHGITFESAESSAFLKALAVERGRMRDLPGSTAAAIHQIVTRRLERLREAAERVLDERVKLGGEGRELLAEADINLPVFFETMNSIDGVRVRADKWREWFPELSRYELDVDRERARRRAVANLLSIAVAANNSFLPSFKSEGALITT